jgi:rSAM/selenodomain-associated transferase 2
MEMLKLSVVIPTINEEANIAELVPLLKKFGGDFLEDLIVVDGGSQDKTCEIAEKLGATVLKCDTASRAEQMNLGAKKSKGNVLYFVHADTRPISTYADDIQIAHIKGYKAGCFQYEFDSPRSLLKINSWFTRFNGVFSGGGDQSLFISRNFFNILGGFDPDYCLMEDFELVSRIRSKTRFHLIPKRIKVSARKYQVNSWIRVQLVNLFVFTLYFMGTKPKKLKKMYSTLLAYE